MKHLMIVALFVLLFSGGEAKSPNLEVQIKTDIDPIINESVNRAEQSAKDLDTAVKNLQKVL